jgi:CDP-glucose 4,6-dehydratase
VESSSFEQLKDLRGPILITGHSGFKGTWLTLLLQSMGIEVVGAALRPKKDSLFNSIFDESDSNLGNWIDLRNSTELANFLGDKKPSYVFHLAAQAIVTEGYQDPIGTFETNVMGTANLMEAIRESNSVKGITVVTTDKVYKNRNLSNRFVEDDALEGIDPYSASKVGTEAVATAWKNIYQKDKEIAVNVVRAGNVIGGGDLSLNRLLPDLIRSVKSGTPAVIRNPESTRPWQHVLDPLLGYLMAADLSLKEKKNLTLNFGPIEGALSVLEVASISRQKWNEISFEIQPSGEIYESKYLELNSTLACDLTGWRPRVNQVEAVGMTIDWWKNRIIGQQSSREVCMRDIDALC